MSSPCRPRSQDRSDGGVNGPDTRILRKRTNLFCFPKYLIPAKKAYTFSKTFCFNTSKVHLFPIKTTQMMVKQLIYDSCMIVEMRTIIAVYLDIQPSHKKHDGMMVVSQIFFYEPYCYDSYLVKITYSLFNKKDLACSNRANTLIIRKNNKHFILFPKLLLSLFNFFQQCRYTP